LCRHHDPFPRAIQIALLWHCRFVPYFDV
jgi:hypothetical protein